MRIIDKAEKAYEARETAKKEMEKLKKDAEKEQQEFEREWYKLGKLIEQDKQVKDFIKTAEEGKKDGKKEKSTMGGTQGTGTSDVKASKTENLNELSNTEKNLRKDVAKSGWTIARDTANIHISMAKV